MQRAVLFAYSDPNSLIGEGPGQERGFCIGVEMGRACSDLEKDNLGPTYGRNDGRSSDSKSSDAIQHAWEELWAINGEDLRVHRAHLHDFPADICTSRKTTVHRPEFTRTGVIYVFETMERLNYRPSGCAVPIDEIELLVVSVMCRIRSVVEGLTIEFDRLLFVCAMYAAGKEKYKKHQFGMGGRRPLRNPSAG
ncbi:hypothetical protein BC938DRAFT_475213 [Jimgerdemannia flammicorona]|uniref:Uncharacterized protein n=1 Tax=Jimgerdemannia flammicorona TaxID=994334 RepID=A0A433PYR5_9FUNG|nr:hypothetical protein BC938DRAFT_475213 [Jimgerdemannia flammicorona]